MGYSGRLYKVSWRITFVTAMASIFFGSIWIGMLLVAFIFSVPVEGGAVVITVSSFFILVYSSAFGAAFLAWSFARSSVRGLDWELSRRGPHEKRAMIAMLETDLAEEEAGTPFTASERVARIKSKVSKGEK